MILLLTVSELGPDNQTIFTVRQTKQSVTNIHHCVFPLNLFFLQLPLIKSNIQANFQRKTVLNMYMFPWPLSLTVTCLWKHNTNLRWKRFQYCLNSLTS